MTPICDMHMHSTNSFDGKNTLEQMCAAAAGQGISAIALTEHLDFDDKGEYQPYFYENQDNIKAAFKNAPALPHTLLYGIEVGGPNFQPDMFEQVIAGHNPDFVLGSVHLFNDMQDIYFVKYTKENYKHYLDLYFETAIEMANFGGFDVLAHLDYPLRYMKHCFPGQPTFAGYDMHIFNLFKILIEKGIGLEINTKSLRCTGQLLEPFVLKMYKDVGGKHLTLGSDAHTAAEVGSGIIQAQKHAKTCGFDYVCIYKKRTPVFLKLS